MINSAVILAGGTIEDELREDGITNKAMLPIGNKLMVEYIIDELKNLGIQNIIMVISADLDDEIASKVTKTANSGENLFSSLKNGLKILENEEDRVLITTCDSPFITAKAISDFIDRCDKRSADFYYSFVKKEDSLRDFPGISRTFVKLKEGSFCGGSLMVVNPQKMEKFEELGFRLTSYRKEPIKLAGILGWKTIFKFIFNKLSINELEEKCSEIVGFPACGISTPYPEIAFNIDKKVELDFARKRLG